MNSQTKKIVEQIVEDTNQLKKKMFWEADPRALATIAAFLFASAGKKLI